MKSIKFIYLIGLVSILGCDTENDVLLPSEFNYISFKTNEINVLESDMGAVTTTFTYSGELLATDLTVNYTVTFPDQDAAQEGVDFMLPASSGSFVLPAGQSTVDVTLLESLVNDELSKGSRAVTFSLQPIQGYILGEPDQRENKSVTINIGEDDLFEFGYTSFEEIPTFGTLTRYPRPAATQDPLPNIQDTDPGSEVPYVSYISTGDELGFTASFLAASVSAIEQEIMGVYNTTVTSANPDSFETNFIDGNQGYVTSDLDGFVTLTFDEITGLNPDVTNAVLDVKLFFRTTSWETEDGIVVYFETADGLGDPILSIFDDDVEAVEGTWQELRIPIPDNKLATGRLVVTFRNGAGTEMIILDSISIKGIL
ncbi:hypothetical protein IWQ47_001003 [Aquimarina sp. EL_43]|uniref:hypothetical protein n=1 Tax=Aquimarina TaxID=290174 RepID=UPI0004BBE7BA|nr:MULTISPECIES: hypothetical protein [Aquimarina]MBG6129695.1 hypothetical protein [Aquimarina sp. EL_35]MBG6150760.1 hypothetical protein [Aquimarina sp. EL_32]MBG6167933.1 hypothetical protein [Aquimarina sp. EL_43]